MVNAKKHQFLNDEKRIKIFMENYPFIMEALWPAYYGMYFDFMQEKNISLQFIFMSFLDMMHPIIYYLNTYIGEVFNKYVNDKYNNKRIGTESLFLLPFMPEYISLLYKFCINNQINAMLYNMQDEKFQDKFTLLSLFSDIKQYDIVFLYNVDYHLNQFLIDYGISECTSGCVYICLDEDSSNPDISSFQYTEDYRFNYNFDDALYLQKNKIGFELYDSLREWKKEVTAPTRDDPEYRKMKKRVRKRDNNTCQCCGYHSDKKTHHNLEVHHIYGYKDHLDYRVEDTNCITLCTDCHKKYHSLYGRNAVAPDTFTKFIRDYNQYNNVNKQTTLI